MLDKIEFLEYIFIIFEMCKIKAGNTGLAIVILLVIPQVLLADSDVFIGRHCWLNTGNLNSLWERKATWDIPEAPATYYIHSSFCDLDNDGDYDVYITGGIDLLMAFENIGSKATPVWQRKIAWDFCPSGMSYVFWADFVDLNGDGKCDLSVNRHDVIKFYKNTGDTLFVWTREPAWDIPIPGETNLAPTYTDLDADGDYDMLVWTWTQSKVKAFENIGSVNNPIWQEKLAWVPPNNPGPHPEPFALGDLDGDGDVDIIGGGGPCPSAYENTGDITNPVWTERLGWITPDAHGFFYPELIDIDGDGSVSVEENELRVEGLELEVYPNPFTQFTVISLQLTDKLITVSLTIHDISGRLIRSFPIHNSRFTTHEVTWDGTNDYGEKIKNGIYFCKLQTGDYTITKKISLIR